MSQTFTHTVFIVDDDEDDRGSIRDAFNESKYLLDYVFMQNGEELMKYFSKANGKNHPSLVLLDLNMPGMNGRDVLKEMKKNELLKPIPVIVVTTSSSPADKEMSYRLGANCFITKPNSFKEFIKID